MRRGFVPFLTLVLITATGVFNVLPVSAVTYGDPVEAPQIEFPEVVPVWVGGKSFCTGTLITQQVVLTAAHCVYGQAGPFQISVGGSTLNNGRLIDIDATWYHPRYDAAYNQNDIGLLHLKTPANVSRLGILPSQSLKSIGKKFLIVGWGTDQNGSVTGKLHRLNLNDQKLASQKAFRGIYNPKTMIGAGRYFPDEILYGGGCTGDSGGPLYMGASRTIIGLTAFGARGCTVYKPTIFTRVDFYTAAIINGIQLLNSRSATVPIPSGKAVPAGIGPTTTTTVAPLAPLTVKFISNQDLTQNGGLDGYFETNTLSPNKVTKICFIVNGTPIPEYDGGEIFFNWSAGKQSGGPGCYENVTSGNGVSWSVLRIRSYQSSTISAVLYDLNGRSVQSPTLRVAGTNLSYPNRALEVYGISKNDFSSTTEIVVKSSSSSESVRVTKVCLIVTMNGSPYGSISSGRNGWNDVGGGCVATSAGPGAYLTYSSSSMISNPVGIQNWIVEGWVYTDDGSVKATSSLAYSS